MNILNRIKRLESESGTGKPFCECFHEHRRKIIDLVYGDKLAYDAGAMLPTGDYCHRCRKPVDVEFERNLQAEIGLMYG